MKKGDKVKFPFGPKDKKGKTKKELEGEVVRVNGKSVDIKADFPNDKGKIVKRKVHEIETV